MRLNFSGVGEDDIREGIRRIGEVVREQVAMYGTLTGAQPSAPARTQVAERPAADGVGLAARGESGSELAKVLRLPAKRAG